MPKYLVEREITGAVIRSLGRNVQWVETFVTEDKIYCICLAPDVKLVRKDGEQGGFPPITSARSRVSSVPLRLEQNEKRGREI